MDIETFRKMCLAHDTSYQYSDDPGVWQRGEARKKSILAARDELGYDVAKVIWNEVCDQKFGQYANTFYWK